MYRKLLSALLVSLLMLSPRAQKTVNATIAHPGNHIFCNVTTLNNGHADAMISLNDTLPSRVTLVTISLAPNKLQTHSYGTH